MVLSIMMKKSLLKNIRNSRPECGNYVLFKTKVAKIDILFMIKTAENHFLWGGTYLEGPYKRVLRGAIEHNKDSSCAVL